MLLLRLGLLPFKRMELTHHESKALFPPKKVLAYHKVKSVEHELVGSRTCVDS